eukprot:810862-Prorocentrum_minimum.AAC.2
MANPAEIPLAAAAAMAAPPAPSPTAFPVPPAASDAAGTKRPYDGGYEGQEGHKFSRRGVLLALPIPPFHSLVVAAFRCADCYGPAFAEETPEDFANAKAKLSKATLDKLDSLIACGQLVDGELDARSLAALSEFTPKGTLEILDQFASPNMDQVRNKSAYLAGVMKRYKRDVVVSMLRNRSSIYPAGRKTVSQLLQMHGSQGVT